MAKRIKPVRDSEGWITSYNDIPVLKIKDLKKASPGSNHLIVNLKGCNGSGKSTIPKMMIEEEESLFLLTRNKEDKKPVATFCPTFNTVIIGTYFTACGGCDTLIPSEVQHIIAKLWLKDVNILFEGVIVGDIKSTFYELMKEFRGQAPRDVHFCFMGTPFKECLKRIQKRNGGKEIKTELVRQKYKNSVSQLRYYLEQGDVGVWVLPTDGSRTRVYERFKAHYTAFYPVF